MAIKDRIQELKREQDLALERKLQEQDREFAEQAAKVHTGLTEARLGPSDSSDSGSDLPEGFPDTDSDRSNTGERMAVENNGNGPIANDIVPDKIVPENEAGLARTALKPERNGG